MKNIFTGKTAEHLILDEVSNLHIHKEMKPALDKIRQAAIINGFTLDIASAFRGFNQQLVIWNAKAQGLRPLYNDRGELLDYQSLSKEEILYAILRWSALPGASRHHWGSDIDVFNKKAMPEGYKLKLTPDECEANGIFGDFHFWLDQNLGKFNFYRPYNVDHGGIAPEKWHLSYAPISNSYQAALTYEMVEATILETEIELKDIILKELPEIYSRFINI